MKSSRPNRQRARRAASELLAQFEVSALPVDVDRLARELAIEVEERSMLPGIFGATAHDGKRMRILLSPECFNREHRRFTLAHELGHCCIDGHAEALLGSGTELHYSLAPSHGRRDSIEVEADAFAAFLLMPEELLGRVLIGAEPSLAIVRTFASAAEVSLTAAAIRATELIPDPLAMVLSERGVIEWASFSSSMRVHDWAKRNYKREPVPTASVSMALAKNATRLRDESADSGEACLADWFPGAPGVSAVEEALGLGDYGKVLTMLYAPALPSAEAVEYSRRGALKPAGDWRDALRTYRWDDPDLQED